MATPKVQCISIIDEADTFTQATFDADWSTFRTNYPNREFWLLAPRPAYTNELRVPAAYTSDSFAYGPINVNRDNGNASQRSDWFAICNIGSLPAGSIISVALDTSGSMTLSTVRESYDYFLLRCADAGIEIVLNTTFSDERWIPPHNKDVAPSANLTADRTSIIAGESVTLSWIVFGDATSASLNQGIGAVEFEGTLVVTPGTTRTYTLTAFGPAGETSRSVIITVLVPPTITLSLNKSSIAAGQCAVLSWFTQGDADTIQWISGSVDNFNLTSNSTVCPADTTTYTAKVIGNGGEDTDSITLIVNQVPTLSFTVPDTVNYGDAVSLEYESKYSNIVLNLKVSYQYTDGTTTLIDDIDLPNPSSGELNGAGNSVSGTRDLDIEYGEFGPQFINIVMTASGGGGQITISKDIEVLIDITPTNIIIPETEDKFKDQDPVFAPETEILSELLLIDDIDIPVEIKSNFPIQVDINGDGTWRNVRQIAP